MARTSTAGELAYLGVRFHLDSCVGLKGEYMSFRTLQWESQVPSLGYSFIRANEFQVSCRPAPKMLQAQSVVPYGIRCALCSEDGPSWAAPSALVGGFPPLRGCENSQPLVGGLALSPPLVG